jgi:hypothetical protein
MFYRICDHYKTCKDFKLEIYYNFGRVLCCFPSYSTSFSSEDSYQKNCDGKMVQMQLCPEIVYQIIKATRINNA